MVLETMEGQQPPPPGIDDFHQTHPVETPELIQNSLEMFREQLGEDFDDPIPTEKFHLMFLRTDVFAVDLAVKRYKDYWKKRLELMGSASEIISLDDEDSATLEYGYARLVRNHPRIVILDPARTPPNYNAKSVVRSIYFTLHQALENSEELQRKGAVFVIDCGTIRSFDRKLVKMVDAIFSDGFPLRQTMCCLINLPTIATWVVGLLRKMLKPELRKRLRVVSDNKKLPQIAGLPFQEMEKLVGYQPWR